MGLPAKLGLFRNAASSVIRCKELLTYNKQSNLDDLQKTSVCPIVVNNGKVCYEVDVNERSKLYSPETVLEHLYSKLYGNEFCGWVSQLSY